MNVNYVDVICGGQVYCAVDVLRKCSDVYYHLLLIRWFGEYSGSIAGARGEMVALAAINPKFRNETVTIAPTTTQKIDSHLVEWRLKYKSLQYSDTNKPIDDLLKSEVLVMHDLKDRLILGKIMAKNIPSVLFCQNDKGISLMLGTEELPVDKVVLCLVKQDEAGRFTVIGFRRATHKNHLKEIIKQSNDHNLLLYYSSFTTNDTEIVAEGPWILLPASLRSFSPNKELANDVIMSTDSESIETSDVTIETVPEGTQDYELVINENGLTCPYCEKPLKSTFGLTNHINHKHPDRKEEYERAYKA